MSGTESSIEIASMKTTDINKQVNISLMVYYTEEFADMTPNIQDFINHQISKTNQGYINSKIPVRIHLHCAEKATVKETDNGNMMETFFGMKENDKLKNSADAATLLGSLHLVFSLERFSF